MNDVFRPWLYTCKAILGWGQRVANEMNLLWIMPLVQRPVDQQSSALPWMPRKYIKHLILIWLRTQNGQ